MLSESKRSLPARGAWIEISVLVCQALALCGRSPQGERGLKFLLCALMIARYKSLPARGAWIEIPFRATRSRYSTVAPRKGSVD